MPKQPNAITWFVILFVLTSILAIVVPPSTTALHTLHITGSTYHLLVITLLIPYGLIWFSAFYAYDKLYQYAHALDGTAEGYAFRWIAQGVQVLAWGLMLGTILTLLLGAITASHPGFTAAQTIISHYFTLAISLASFILIQNGTYRLVEFVHARRTQASIRWLILIGVLIGAFFQRLVMYNRVENGNPYYLSVYPLILTIVAPYIFTWMMGIMSTHELRLYSTRVKGVLYRKALQLLANGLTLVIVASIAVQYVNAALTPTGNISLSAILTLVYGLLGAEALGLALVAVGATRLKKIEDV